MAYRTRINCEMKDGDYLFKRILSGLLVSAMLTGSVVYLTGCSNSQNGSDDNTSTNTSTEYAHADKIDNGTILQCFSWDFNTIKESMADIAASGYTALQTSPINACLEGENGGMQLYGDGKWYYHYQPTDFKIGNYQLGTRDEFKAMCDEAEKYGIKVIVDVIANHTTPTTSAVSQDLIDAGGGSLDTLYHKNNAYDLNDFSNRLACTTYKMGGLPDINTERTSFQDYFIEYLNDCVACGADGFRYDTAKHIGLPDDPKEDDGFTNNFWQRVITEVNNADNLFIYGEVLQGNNERIADYIEAIGHTTASTYGSKIRGAITNNILSKGTVSDYWLGDAPLNMVTWVESHDNYINDGNWYNMTKEQVILGWAVITARKDGTPLFFDRPYYSSVENEWGMNRIGTEGDDMYKDKSVKAVNFFRTAMIGEDENIVNPNSDSTAVMIERGTKGAVIVNTKDALKTGFETNLADGTYVNRVDGKTEYTVKNGKLTSDADIPANSVVVLYNDGYNEYEAAAEVGVAEDTVFNIQSGKTATVTLTCANTDNAEYALNGAAAVSYKNGETVTVSVPSGSDIATLELTAKNSKGVKTYERVVFATEVKYSISSGTKVYFEKPDSWGDQIFAYVYNDELYESETWPGIEMTKESDGKYSYTFTEDWETPYIIFNDGDEDGSQQYPADNGLTVEDGKTYTIE